MPLGRVLNFQDSVFFVQKLSANKIGGGILVRIFYAVAH